MNLPPLPRWFAWLLVGVLGCTQADAAVRPAVKACAVCHDAAPAPRLEGLSRSYLTRQITAFIRVDRSLSVSGRTCSGDALRSLPPAELLAVVNHYAEQVPDAPPPSEAPAERLERGRQLFVEGRLASGIQPCAACHGRDALGGAQRGLEGAAVAPRLAGQRESYLLEQLRSFRKGSRHNDFQSVMQRMVADLGDADLDALAAWLAALDPSTLPPAPVAESAGDMPEKAALCQACHGVGGESMAETFPKIGGLPASQIAKQLRDIKAGRRTVDVMTPIVYTLTDAEIDAIAAYFSRSTMHRGPYDPLAARRGEELFYKGNLDTGGYPACLYCHGIDGHGISGVEWAPGGIPRLAGQHPGYVRKAIGDFREGRRSNDHAQMMRLVAIRMTDAEIADVAQYVYSLGDKPAPDPVEEATR